MAVRSFARAVFNEMATLANAGLQFSCVLTRAESLVKILDSKTQLVQSLSGLKMRVEPQLDSQKSSFQPS